MQPPTIFLGVKYSAAGERMHCTTRLFGYTNAFAGRQISCVLPKSLWIAASCAV
jgi:hypothetical protein